VNNVQGANSSKVVSVTADRLVAGVSPRTWERSGLLAERKLYSALTEGVGVISAV
jgi:hypothetical protein